MFALAFTHNRYDTIDYVALHSTSGSLTYSYLGDAFPLGVSSVQLAFSPTRSFDSDTFTEVGNDSVTVFRVNHDRGPVAVVAATVRRSRRRRSVRSWVRFWLGTRPISTTDAAAPGRGLVGGTLGARTDAASSRPARARRRRRGGSARRGRGRVGTAPGRRRATRRARATTPSPAHPKASHQSHERSRRQDRDRARDDEEHEGDRPRREEHAVDERHLSVVRDVARPSTEAVEPPFGSFERLGEHVAGMRDRVAQQRATRRDRATSGSRARATGRGPRSRPRARPAHRARRRCGRCGRALRGGRAGACRDRRTSRGDRERAARVPRTRSRSAAGCGRRARRRRAPRSRRARARPRRRRRAASTGRRRNPAITTPTTMTSPGEANRHRVPVAERGPRERARDDEHQRAWPRAALGEPERRRERRRAAG